MNKERTENPYWKGTPAHSAWDKGYTAALADSAGIPREPKPMPFGMPRPMWPR